MDFKNISKPLGDIFKPEPNLGRDVTRIFQDPDTIVSGQPIKYYYDLYKATSKELQDFGLNGANNVQNWGLNLK